jgi:hypothetical protein
MPIVMTPYMLHSTVYTLFLLGLPLCTLLLWFYSFFQVPFTPSMPWIHPRPIDTWVAPLSLFWIHWQKVYSNIAQLRPILNTIQYCSAGQSHVSALPFFSTDRNRTSRMYCSCDSPFETWHACFNFKYLTLCPLL